MIMRVERASVRRRWLAMALVGLGGFPVLAPMAQAQNTYTWRITGGDGTWDTTTNNWLLSGLPAAWSNGPNIAVFDQARRDTFIGVATGGITAGSLSFLNNGAFTYTIGTANRQLTLNNGASDALITVGRGTIGTGNYAGVGGNTLTGSPLVFFNNLVIANNGAFGTTALTLAGTVNHTSSGGSISVSGKANTTIGGAIGVSVTGGITKSGTGTLNLSGTNLFTGGVAINGGVLNAASNAALGNAANSVSISGGSVLRFTGNLSTARALAINGSTGNPSGIDLASGTTTTLTGSGASAGLVGSGTALISLTNGTTAGTLSIEGAQSGFTGSLVVGTPGMQLVGHMPAPRIFATTPGATLRLQNAGTLANVANVTVNNGALLTITQPTTAITGRLGSAPITLNSGRFGYTTSANGNAAITENFGALSITGTPVIFGSEAAGPTAGTSLTFASLNRTDNAGLWLRAGSAAGIGGTPGANTVNYKLGSAPTLSGSGVAGTPQVGILPWAAYLGPGETSAQNLVTYDANGFRPLTSAEVTPVTSFAELSGAAGNNVSLQGYVLMSGDATINSLFNPGYLIQGTGTLTVASGTVATPGFGFFSGPTLNFGTSTGYFHIGDQFIFDSGSSLSGSSGLSVNGLNSNGSSYLNLVSAGTSTLSGGITINGNAKVAFARDDQLGATGAGNDITLGGGALQYAGTGGSLDPARNIIVNAANGTITGSLGGLQIPGLISGPGQLQFGGGSTAVLVQLTGGANTYSGGTVLGAGILGINNANQLGTGSLLLNRGTLRADADLVFASAPHVAASSTINTNGFSIALNGGLSGIGGEFGTNNTQNSNTLTKTGLGTLTVSADSTFAGVLELAGGTFSLNGGGKLLELAELEAGAGTTMTLDNTATNVTDRLGDANPITLSSGGTLRLIGNASAGGQETTGPLTVVGLGNSIQVEASGGQISSLLLEDLVAPYTSINTVLVRGTNIAAGSGTAGHVFLKRFNGDTGAPANGTLLPNVMAEDLSNPGVFASAIYDTAVGIRPVVASDFLNGAVLQNAAPTNTPTTAHFRVNPSVANPVPVIDASNRVSSLRFAPGGVLDYPGSVPGELRVGIIETEAGGAAASITNSGTGLLNLVGSSLYLLTGADMTVAAGLDITGNLSKNGAAALTFNGDVDSLSSITVNAGTLTFNNSGPITSGTLRINGGALNFGTGVGAASFTTINGTAGTLNLGATNLTISNGGSYSGIITGTGGLINSNSGPPSSATLTLGGANTFSGSITGSSPNPSYIITHPSALGTGTLDLSSQSQSSFITATLGYDFGAAGFVGTVANNIILPSAAVTVNIGKTSIFNQGQTLRLTGLLSGGGAGMSLELNRNSGFSPNIVVLDNPNNSFLGTIRNGTSGSFAITSNGALGNANNPISLSSSSSGLGSMRFDANNITVGSGHTITSASGSINTNGNNAAIAGVLAGTGGFTKIGAGALTLSNPANTFSGPMRVSGGSLLVNGNLAGGATLTVTSGSLPGDPLVPGGTLGGTGFIGATNAPRNVSIENGGTLAPGNSTGLLTVNGNVAFAPHFDFYDDPIFAVEVNGTTVGTGYDQLAVNGAVDLGGANLLLSFGFTPSMSDMFFLVSNDGTDPITGMFYGLAEGSQFTTNIGGTNYTGQITYQGDFGALLTSGGNDIAIFGLTVAIPEPGSLALLGFSALSGAALFHRRRKS